MKQLNNKKNRLPQIDAWRGFAIFCVVLYHSIIEFPINLQENNILKSLYDYISVFNMPLFFFISGVCFSYNGNYKVYIIKKIKRVLVPYFSISILNFVCKSILPGLVNNQVSIRSFIVDMFLYGGEYWFLYVMFIMFLVFPLVIKLENKTNKYFIEILFITISLLKLNTNIFCVVPLFRYFVFFNTGYLLKDIILSNIRKETNILIPLVILAISIIIFAINTKLDIRLFEMFDAIIIILATYMFANNNLFIKIFERYGIYSLQIYCLNGFLLVLSRTLICKLTASAFIIIPFIVLICLSLSYVIIKYIISKIGIARSLLGLDN